MSSSTNINTNFNSNPAALTLSPAAATSKTIATPTLSPIIESSVEESMKTKGSKFSDIQSKIHKSFSLKGPIKEVSPEVVVPPLSPLPKLPFLSQVVAVGGNMNTLEKFSFGFKIPEDSIYRKVSACIPLIGIIPTLINERSLRKKINKAGPSDKVIKLIQVKNDYKIASIVRKTLTIASIVAGIALGFFSIGLGGGAIVISSTCAVMYGYAIHKNVKFINQIKAEQKEAIAEGFIFY